MGRIPVWLAGPLLAVAGHEPLASPLARGIAVAVVVATWGVYLLVGRLRARKRNQAMLEAMGQQGLWTSPGGATPA